MQNYAEWLCEHNMDMSALINEVSSDATRYSVEVNYRTGFPEVVDGYAKLILSYVSAGMKREGYHIKHVFSEKPFRLLISTRQWEDGEWVGVVSFNHAHKQFYFSKGFWNKDRGTVSIQQTEHLPEANAAEIVRKLTGYMHLLQKEQPREINKLKPAALRRGPKK